MIEIAYCCARCGYKSHHKAKMRVHFDRKRTCQGLLDPSFELTDEAKQFILDNRVYSTPKISEHQKMTAKEQILCLRLEVAMLRGKHDEKFYQSVVEKYLGKSHMKLKHCITDVSTSTAHAEIKRWDRYAECIGQLHVYKAHSPRSEYHAYMFDETCGKSKIRIAIETMHKSFPGIKLFTFDTTKDKVKIVNVDTKEVVFTFEIESNDV